MPFVPPSLLLSPHSRPLPLAVVSSGYHGEDHTTCWRCCKMRHRVRQCTALRNRIQPLTENRLAVIQVCYDYSRYAISDSWHFDYVTTEKALTARTRNTKQNIRKDVKVRGAMRVVS